MSQYLVADRALAGDDERIVERVNERDPGLVRELVTMRFRVRVSVAAEDDFSAHVADGVDLDLRGGLRHDDQGADAEMARRERHSLGVVAGARGDDSGGAFRRRQVRDVAVRATDLEAEDRLQIFALEENG